MSTPFSHFFQKINQIAPLECEFTEVLESIAVKPKTLYFRGKMPENMSKTTANSTKIIHKLQQKQAEMSSLQNRTERPKTVAIVGSRHNTRYGEETAYQLAYELGKHDVVVVSGLAFGIDSIAHRGCLAAKGTTVAVLGNPIDRIHPTAHASLAREIIQNNGAIISEYPPYTEEYQKAPLAPGEYYNGFGERCLDYRTSFLYRNRLIAGLADAVVIVEAAEKSGSLNTATHALNQGKEVFAVPGNITNPYSQGCNKLIRQGAFPYTEPRDILDYLFPEEYIRHQKHQKQQNLIGDTDVETKILQALSEGARSGEEVMAATHLPPEVFNETISLLEIKGRLHPLGLNHWSLV